MPRKTAKATEDLTFVKVAQGPKPLASENKHRDLASELYKKNWVKSTIDDYERKVLGIGTGTTQVKPNLKYKARMFSPEFEKEANLFSELLNDPKFTIIYMKDNWDMQGKYNVFIIYSENLDYQKPQQDQPNE